MGALGTQTGGSIVRPASYCGVVGLKPKYGLLEMEGIFPFSLHLDHVGPITRCVSDAADVYSCMEWPSFGSENLRLPDEYDVSIHIRWLQGDFLAEADGESHEHFLGVRSRFGSCKQGSIKLPEFMHSARANHRRIMAVDGADVHREAYEQRPSDFGKEIRGLISEGRDAKVLDYANSLRYQRSVVRRLRDIHNWAEEEDVIVWAMPSTPTPAPGRDSTGDPVFNSLWSLAGIPTLTIPCGLSSQGLPFGLQLIGFFIEDVFQAAFLCEKSLAICHRPRLLSES